MCHPSPATPNPSSRACAGDGENERRFRPDKGFAGVDYSAAAQAAGDGQPVQFEKDAPEADPFGLDQFLTDVTLFTSPLLHTPRRRGSQCRARMLALDGTTWM